MLKTRYPKSPSTLSSELRSTASSSTTRTVPRAAIIAVHDVCVGPGRQVIEVTLGADRAWWSDWSSKTPRPGNRETLTTLTSHAASTSLAAVSHSGTIYDRGCPSLWGTRRGQGLYSLLPEVTHA